MIMEKKVDINYTFSYGVATNSIRGTKSMEYFTVIKIKS